MHWACQENKFIIFLFLFVFGGRLDATDVNDQDGISKFLQRFEDGTISSRLHRKLLFIFLKSISKSDKQIVLFHVTKKGWLKSLAALLKCGADANGREPELGNTALHQAVLWNQPESLKILLRENSDPNAADFINNVTPLHIAAEKGHLECLKILIASGADIEAKGCEDETPLLCAASNKQLDCLNFLLLHGASVNASNNQGFTSLMEAASGGNVECVKALILGGANVNKKDQRGITPLHRAAISSSSEVIKLLLESGANVNETDRAGETPLYLAWLSAPVSTFEEIQVCSDLLIQYGGEMSQLSDYSMKHPHIVKLRQERPNIFKIRTDVSVLDLPKNPLN